MRADSDSDSAWSWAGLWLCLAALGLLGLSGLLALPVLLDAEMPRDRLSALRSLWLQVVGTLGLAVVAAIAGVACLRRLPR